MRTLSSLLTGVLSGAQIPVRLFARFFMPGTTYGASDAPDSFTYGGVNYLGLGGAFSFDPGTNGLDQRPSGGSISLSASDPAVLEAAFLDNYRAMPVEAGFLFYSPTSGDLAEDFVVMAGRMDNLEETIEPGDPQKPEEPTKATISVAVAPVADRLARPGVRVRSDADQRAYRDADDGGFKDVGLAGRVPISWGIAGANSPWSANPRG